MSIGITLSMLGKSRELYFGGGSGNWKILSVSVVLLTLGLEITVKI